MKKFLIILLGLSFVFADVIENEVQVTEEVIEQVEEKEGVTFGTNISKIDLDEYTQIPNAKYSLSDGFVFEKDAIFLEKEVKQVLKFNTKGDFEMMFYINETDSFDGEDFKKAPEDGMKFAKGHIDFMNQAVDFTLEEEDLFKEKASEAEIDFYNLGHPLTINNMYIKLSNNFDKTYAITTLKMCSSVDAPSSCKQCEYIEGVDKDVHCINMFIYHKPLPFNINEEPKDNTSDKEAKED